MGANGRLHRLRVQCISSQTHAAPRSEPAKRTRRGIVGLMGALRWCSFRGASRATKGVRNRGYIGARKIFD